MTKESSLWTCFQAALPSDAHAVRVENGVELGTPDVNLCLPPCRIPTGADGTFTVDGVNSGWDGWIELKVQLPPKKDKTFFRCEHFTMEQRQWAVDRTRAGGNAYLLLQVDRAVETSVKDIGNPHQPVSTGPKYLWLRGDVAAVWVGQCTLAELVEKCEWSGDSLAGLIDYLRSI